MSEQNRIAEAQHGNDKNYYQHNNLGQQEHAEAATTERQNSSLNDDLSPNNASISKESQQGQKMGTRSLHGRSHPLYRTSNSIYGAKKATEASKVTEYHAHNGQFTNTFCGGMFRNHSLNCNKTRHHALPDPSFGSNPFFPPDRL